MLPIQPYLLPINPFSRPGKKLRAVKGIVMHYTASPGAPALNISRYFTGLAKQNPKDNVEDRYASAHYSVDALSIYQNIPTDEMAYHCGSKTYTKDALTRLGTYPNDSTIGIEMCIDHQGNITEQTFQNAADLVSMLCKQFGLTTADVWTHKAIVGWKDCPLPWIKNPNELERFKKAVANRLAPQAKPTYPSIRAVVGRNLPAIVVNRATHIIWTCLPLLNIKHEYKGNGLFLINDRLVQGVIHEGDTYLPWGEISPRELTPFQIDEGWMFVYQP